LEFLWRFQLNIKIDEVFANEKEMRSKRTNEMMLICLWVGLFILYKAVSIGKIFQGKEMNSYFIPLLTSLGGLLLAFGLVDLLNNIINKKKFDKLVEEEIKYRRPDCANKSPDIEAFEKNMEKAIKEIKFNPVFAIIKSILFFGIILNTCGFIIDYIVFPKITIKIDKNTCFNPLKNHINADPNLIKLFSAFNNIHFSINYINTEEDMDKALAD
jgi:hypothetical protein